MSAGGARSSRASCAHPRAARRPAAPLRCSERCELGVSETKGWSSSRTARYFQYSTVFTSVPAPPGVFEP